MSKRRLLLLVKCLVSIGLLAVILYRADLREMMTALRKLNLVAFGGALCCMTFGVLLRSYKWQLLLHAQGARISLGSTLGVTYMSMFFNNFFLGTLGGDAFRAYQATGYSKSAGSAASSVIMERATGFFSAMLLVMAIGILLVLRSEALVSIKLLIAIVLVAVIGVLCVIGVLLMSSRLASFPIVCRVTFAREFVDDVTGSIWRYKDHPSVVVTTLILSLGFHVVQAVGLYLFALAANTTVSFMPLLFIAPLVGILVVIPISINGIGVKEGTYVFYFEQIGVGGPEALLIALSGRVGNMILSLIGGLLFLVRFMGRRKVPTVTK